MNAKQVIAGTLAAVMAAGQLFLPVTAAFAADGDNSPVMNREGVWLTELYQNDIDRSKAKDNREKDGYVPLHYLYKSGTDLMEYIEITSTFDEDIKLNERYEIYQNGKKMTLTEPDGSSDITISKGQPVVIWNQRKDVAGPTEQEFRREMRVPDSAKVIIADCGAENWPVSSSFSIQEKESGKTVSAFSAETAVHTADGLSVELRIPAYGSDMEVFRVLTLPSAGYVYNEQLRGIIAPTVPDQEYAEGLLLTEVRPNDKNRKDDYATESDLMECFEVINTTDHTVDLNEDYHLMYTVKEGQRKITPVHHYADEVWQMTTDNCTVQPGSPAVIWIYRKDMLDDWSTFPTEKDFREAYKIPDDVPVYLVLNQNGMNNTQRSIEIYKTGDGDDTLVSYYSYLGADDCKDNKSAELRVSADGPRMIIHTPNAGTSMGMVSNSQIAYVKDDGSALQLHLQGTVPDHVMQGQDLRVNFSYQEVGALPRVSISTFYRFDGQGSWTQTTENYRRVPNLYEVLISADELYSHHSVEFYVSADNRYRSTVSPVYTVKIQGLNEVDGVRSNITENEAVSGIVSVTVNDGGSNQNVSLAIDDSPYSLHPMMEDGAHFTFHADGRDSYFINALTTTDNQHISHIGKWQNTILDGQAIHIDNRYFTRNEETDSYDVTLRIWAGTWGTTTEDTLIPDANRDDFTVTQVALRLPGGSTYLPTRIGPDNISTSAKTNLSTDFDAVHSIGDSKGMCPYMDVSFSVPSSEVNAMGAEIDTTALTDGLHTLKISAGTSSKEIPFVVDNKAPEIDFGFADGDVLSRVILLDPRITDEGDLRTVSAALDDEEISLPFQTTAYRLGIGTHVFSIFAEDAAGNQTVETIRFTVNDPTPTLIDAGAVDITDSSARLYLSLDSDSDTQVHFYGAERIDAANIRTESVNGMLPYLQYTIDIGDMDENSTVSVNWDGESSSADSTHAATLFVRNTTQNTWETVARADSAGSIHGASFPVRDHVQDGCATLLVQCTADSALPSLNTATDGQPAADSWDGSAAPEDYDFCFAWETDTQYYAEEWQHHYLNMNRWIVDHADAMKIKYVIHTGDIVDDYDMIYQWENADEAMKIFDDSGMPYGVLGGNHDVAAGLGDYENYYTYFGTDRFASQPTYGGSYKNNMGHYDLISEGGQDFIVLYMSWNIYQEELDWMNEVLKQYSDRKAILCFHTYTRVAYNGDTLLDYFGQMVQQQVVAKNPNVFAVLNGHYHGSSFETTMFDDDGDGVNDRTVYQICTDYQSGFEGGNEYIKLLYFDLDNNKIYMNSYSPCMDDYNFYDEKPVASLNVPGASDTEIDKMILDVSFDTETKTITETSFEAFLYGSELGSSKPDETTSTAQIEVKDLTPGTEYLWYAVANTVNLGTMTTDLMSFQTLTEKPAPAPIEPVTPVKPDKPVPAPIDPEKPGETAMPIQPVPSAAPEEKPLPETAEPLPQKQPVPTKKAPETGDVGLGLTVWMAAAAAAGSAGLWFVKKRR